MMLSQENAPIYSLDDDEYFDALTTNPNLNVSDSLYTSFDESVVQVMNSRYANYDHDFDPNDTDSDLRCIIQIDKLRQDLKVEMAMILH